MSVFKMTPILTLSVMKTFSSKIPLGIFTLALLLCSFLVQPVRADLIEENKSDTAIKMLVFPKSLRVIENRQSGNTDDRFSDPKRIRKTLLKLDPARIVPAKTGEPVIGPVTRVRLRELAKQYNEDVIFIFRRSSNKEKNSIRHQGLLYLARQKKVLALKESTEAGSGSLDEMDLAGLQFLAKEARRVLHSHKFEKRQSAY
ncbi:MAG: hypothetical protein F3743_01170 [Nitrospinae bacterium]|nr:hypothetical protein [Nitrospinota bacterium]MZH03997.1 hypothetical protein [Nitrospinota bacterium]